LDIFVLNVEIFEWDDLLHLRLDIFLFLSLHKELKPMISIFVCLSWLKNYLLIIFLATKHTDIKGQNWIRYLTGSV